MDIFEKNGYNLTEKMIEDFSLYTDLILEYNKVMNLTAITDREEMKVKHYLDSLLGEEFLEKNSTVIDVGSGAGFPAIPLKIYRNDLKITMLDSLNKRVNFLKTVVEKLDLKDINTIHSRAEEAGQSDMRESYDCAIARAVADMAILAEYSLPLVRVGGKFVAYKGKVDEELANAEKAIRILGGEIESVTKKTLPDGSERSIVVMRKKTPTPKKYPRGQNKPRINPL